MRIGVISDTHIPQQAGQLPDLVLRELQAVDLIIHAGDYVVQEVIEVLQELAPFHGVRGNMDSPKIQKLLPEKEIIKVEDVCIGIIHGYGMGPHALQKAQMEFSRENVDAVVFGHTHNPYNRVHRGKLFFNPGSPTAKRDQDQFTMGFLDIHGKEIQGEILKF